MTGHGTALPPVGIAELSDSDAPDFLERHDLAVLLFVAGEDAPSRTMRARVALVQADLGVAAGALDMDAHRLVAEALGVRSVPELLVFHRGEVVDRILGTAPERVIEDVLAPRVRPHETGRMTASRPEN